MNVQEPLLSSVFADELNSTINRIIHVRVTKRNGSKCITTISGLTSAEAKKCLSKLRKKLSCGGNLNKEDVHLQGDFRKEASSYLTAIGIPDSNIHIHGY
jgi:translation initiation factor SUI1